MKWLEAYENDLRELEAARAGALPLARMKDGSLSRVLEPLVDGSVDEGDAELVQERLWQLCGLELVRSLRAEARLQLRLVPLYARLLIAPPEDWRDFARLLNELRFQSIVSLLRGFQAHGATPPISAVPKRSVPVARAIVSLGQREGGAR